MLPVAIYRLLLMAFIYYLLKRQTLGIWAVIALTGLFYPQYVLLEAGVLIILFLWRSLLGRKSNHPSLFVGGLLISGLVLVPYVITGNPFDPPISLAEPHRYPEFWVGGRNSFFDVNLRYYIFLQGTKQFSLGSVTFFENNC